MASPPPPGYVVAQTSALRVVRGDFIDME